MMQVRSLTLDDQLPGPANPSERERFLEAVLASSCDCIKVLDLDANVVFMSEGGQRIMEVSDFNAIKGCPWPNFWSGAGSTAAKDAIATARAGGVGHFRAKADTMAGNLRWWDVMVTPIMGVDGRPERLLSVSRDITEMMHAADRLRESEAQTRLMGEELQHRVKNTLAIVASIIRQTLRSSPNPAAAQDTIGHRLAAMGRAHDMLTAGGWTNAGLEAIIKATLDYHDDRTGRFRIEGPKASLTAAAATALALLLHELATNATKYGALSSPEGEVEITWTLTPDPARRDGPHVLDLVWREQGGPPVVPPTQRGFGTKLIERALASTPHGKAVQSFRPDGLLCTVNVLADPLNPP